MGEPVVKKKRGQEYIAPWEKAFDRVLNPLDEFIHRQTTSGVLLMLCAVLALIIANSPLRPVYEHLLELPLTIGTPGFQLSKSLHHWINDGLMALFFFVIGLELKREILVGELANVRRAMLPIIAALGGMVLPALIYYVISPAGPEMKGWGIPIATDIAFALGALALLGDRVPKGVLTFLIALAIVDDLGAVLVIAVAYTDTLDYLALSVAAGVLLLLVSLNMGGIRRPLPYLLLGIVLWVAMLKSGVHATLAGVFLAFTIPMRPKYDQDLFLVHISEVIEKIRQACQKERDIFKNHELFSRVRALGVGAQRAQAPAQILEHNLHLPTAYIIIPIFSLANAGIPVEGIDLPTLFTHPIAMGVGAGLVVGKLVGISGFTWLALRLGLTELPEGIDFRHIIGVGLMGGIGFTMSIFIAELGFAHQQEALLMAKSGILLGSLIAGVSGFVWLRCMVPGGAKHAVGIEQEKGEDERQTR